MLVIVDSLPMDCRAPATTASAPPRSHSMTPAKPRRTLVTAAAGFLGAAILLLPLIITSPQSAEAQPVTRVTESGEDMGGRISAAEQRKEMISVLKNLSTRLERLETSISRGISVKVTDMPAIRVERGTEGTEEAAAENAASPRPGIRSLTPGKAKR